MSKTPRVDAIKNDYEHLPLSANMRIWPLARQLETELADKDRQLAEARAEIKRKDKLIEQMRVELKGFVDILRILTRNSDKAPSDEFTIAMITCIGRNELIIEAALSAAERGE